ncbi:MAG: translocation protein TolB [Bdellovibrio sp.]|nr:MAG: translocation protein TolB [Bdellovibrio sp.]
MTTRRNTAKRRPPASHPNAQILWVPAFLSPPGFLLPLSFLLLPSFLLAPLILIASLILRPSLAWADPPADGQIYIQVGQAQTHKSLLAIPPPNFIGSPGANRSYQSVGADLYRVIQNDLSVSGYFKYVPASAYLEDPSKTDIKPFPTSEKGFKFDNWKVLKADFLVRMSYATAGDTISLETYTYHVAKNQLIFGKKYEGPKAGLRRIAHSFCNDFLEALTGKTGMYLSKVTLSSDRAGGESREIFIMDWDGTNFEKITNHKSIALSPVWSPDNKKIAYTAFVQRAKTKTRNADLFIYEVATAKRWLVSYRQGINSGASFGLDGKHIFLTLSQEGTPDIYKMTLDGELVSKVTNGPHGAMNVEPSVSPDGKKIAFSTDRSGQTMIFVMDIDGSNPRRITVAGKFNASPSWSPDGTRIAFAGWIDDHFDIYSMKTDGSDLIPITAAKKSNGKRANNEDPVFSPDGRFLMYSSNRTGKSQIYISNLDGTEERRVTDDNFNYFKPKWSTNL